jgi:hypothetical protein
MIRENEGESPVIGLGKINVDFSTNPFDSKLLKIGIGRKHPAIKLPIIIASCL